MEAAETEQPLETATTVTYRIERGINYI